MAGDLRVSMLLSLDARAARAEAAAMRGEMTNLGSAARKAGQDAQAGGSGINFAGTAASATAAQVLELARNGEDVSSILNAMRAAANPLVGEYLSLEQSIRAVTQAEDLGVLTTKEAALAVDQLARAQIQLRAAIDAGGGSIEANTRAVIAQDSAVQTLIAQTTGLASASQNSIAAELQHGAALDALRARFDPLFAASRAYEIQLQDIAEAERQGALSAVQAGAARERAAQMLTPAMNGIARGSRGAASEVANLGFQLNDIAMMTAAGQNPLMLAMQQGSQVSQVFEIMRQRGVAVGPALVTAFTQVLSPMSLLTMGVIALGAYAVQAFMDAETSAKSFEDELKDLETVSNRLRENSRLLFGDGIDTKFGSLNTQARALTETLVQLDRASELRTLRDTLETKFSETVDPTFWQNANQYLANLASGGQLGSYTNTDLAAGNWAALGTALPFDQFKAMRAEIDQLAADGKVDEVTKKLIDLGKAMAGGGAVSGMTTDAQTLLSDLSKVALSTAETEAIFNGSAARAASEKRAGEIIAQDQRSVELARARVAYGEQSAQYRAVEAQQARAAVEVEITRLQLDKQSTQAAQMRAAVEDKIKVAEQAHQADIAKSAAAMLAQYQAEAHIAQLTAKYGADSLEVAHARAAAERGVQAAQLEAQGITGELADNLLQAWDSARGIAGVDMAAGIGAASAEAQLLAANLGVSLDKAVGIMNLKAKADAVTPRVSFGLPGVETGATGTVLGFGSNSASPASTVVTPPRSADWKDYSVHGGGGGGAGSSAKAETSALDDLRKSEQKQIDQLRLLDPVQREIEANHDALSTAVGKERDKVEDLIRERMRLQGIRDTIDQIGQTGKEAFTGLITGATSFKDAIGMLLSKLADMAASSAWDMLWSGGGATTGLGGFLGSLFGLGSPVAKADGGRISGAGGPRDDSIAAWLSDGEFVVNAGATAANLPLLTAINDGVSLDRIRAMIGGRMPAFATGGMISQSVVRRVQGAAQDGDVAALAAASKSSDLPAVNMPISVDARGAQRGAAEEFTASLMRAMPEIERRAIAAVVRAKSQGKMK